MTTARIGVWQAAGMLFLGATFGVAACGGSVSPGGSGGSGGAGGNAAAGSGAGGAGDVSSSSSTTTGSGTPAEDCATICAFFDANCKTDADCVEDCIKRSQDGDCSGPFTKLVACYVDHLDTATCDDDTPPPECVAVAEAFGDCNKPSACPSDCGMDVDGACECSSDCDGVKKKVACSAADGSGMRSCNCFLDGSSVGTCTDPASVECSQEETCCTLLWANP